MIEQFCELYGNDLFEKVCSTMYGDEKHPEIKSVESIVHGLLETTFYVQVEVFDKETNSKRILNLEIQDGISVGTDLVKMSFAELDIPQEKDFTIYKIVPKNDSELVKKRFEHVKEQQWFKQLERDMNYDFKNSPTDKVESHYKTKLEKMDAKIVTESIKIDADIKKIV